jgi:ATP-dependent Clp protease ATP-binding subunit ClpA
MFERFTRAAREAVVQAQGQARLLRHDEIGPEHLLLAILADQSAGARVLQSFGADLDEVRAHVIAGPKLDADALRALGIDLEEVRRRVEQTFGAGALDRPMRRPWWRRRLRHIPFTVAAKLALEQSLREALALGHRYIGTEHLVLGLLADTHGTARRVLAASGVHPTQDDVRAAVRREVDRAA